MSRAQRAAGREGLPRVAPHVLLRSSMDAEPYAKGFHMTSRCRARLAVAAFACVAVLPLSALAADPAAPASGYDYPTQGRVEYVLGCMDDNGHDFANVYKCSCVIDKIAAALPYDDYVEQMTFAKYATLGGEGGNEFRVDRARAQTRKYRALQQEAYQACGLAKATPSAAK
ncbi:hypothetical protein BCAR13_960016 [Paraburkholderia caribensis]|nr:hypothetical protein BCAR13_960016 [Paraburkholderia caribensis]